MGIKDMGIIEDPKQRKQAQELAAQRGLSNTARRCRLMTIERRMKFWDIMNSAFLNDQG